MPFPFDHKYPGTDLHELDLGYIIEQIKDLRIQMKEYGDINKMHYANPLDWNITTQYPAYTIVRDANSSLLYISMQPVPEGIGLDNSAYWQTLGSYQGDSDYLRYAIVPYDEPDYRVATRAYAVNEYFWGADNNIYCVDRPVQQGGSFSPSNCHMVTVASELTYLKNEASSLQNQIDNIEVDTTDKMPVRSHRKYVVLMDSYGVTHGTETGLDTWLKSFVGMDSSNSWTYPHDSARFGPHYPTGQNPGISYIEELQAYNSSIPKTEITDIIVETAGNDINETEADWKDAVDTFVTYAKQNFPNAQIRVAFCLFAYVRSSRQTKYAFCNSLKQYIIEHPDISWMTGIEYADKDYSAYRNTTHPDGLGNRYFAGAIANSILGESAAYNVPHAKRSKFTETGTTAVTSWDTNNGIQSFQLDSTVYIRFAANEFTLNPITVPAPGSYGENWNKYYTIDLGKIDDNRFFGEPQSTVLFPMMNTAVCYQSLEGQSDQWRYVDSSYIYFDSVSNECHAIIRFYVSNPGGPDASSALTIKKLRFENSDHYVPAMYV